MGDLQGEVVSGSWPKVQTWTYRNFQYENKVHSFKLVAASGRILLCYFSAAGMFYPLSKGYLVYRNEMQPVVLRIYFSSWNDRNNFSEDISIKCSNLCWLISSNAFYKVWHSNHWDA